MAEALALFVIAILGTAFAFRRSRRRLLAGKYGRFAFFEHVILPWPLFFCVGAVGFYLSATSQLSVDEYVMLAGVATFLAIPVYPPVILLFFVFFAIDRLGLPFTTGEALTFTLKAVFLLLGAAAIGNTIGYLDGRRESRLKGQAT